MTLLQKLTNNAKNAFPRILLPESADERILLAALAADHQKIAQIILLGNKEKLEQRLSALNNDSIHSIEFIDLTDKGLLSSYAQSLYEIRGSKGLSLSDAGELVKKNTVFAMLALGRGEADGVGLTEHPQLRHAASAVQRRAVVGLQHLCGRQRSGQRPT